MSENGEMIGYNEWKKQFKNCSEKVYHRAYDTATGQLLFTILKGKIVPRLMRARCGLTIFQKACMFKKCPLLQSSERANRQVREEGKETE